MQIPVFPWIDSVGEGISSEVLFLLLDNAYSLKYKKCVVEVDSFFRYMKDDDITKYVADNIGKWVGCIAD